MRSRTGPKGNDLFTARVETALGTCRVVGSREGVRRVYLPGSAPAAGEAEGDSSGGIREVPPVVRRAAEAIRRHLSGHPQEFLDVPLDLPAATPFDRLIYEAARDVPAGCTATYGELARAAGRPGSARAVGRALGRNPVPLLVPCHRIVAASGDLRGFSAPGGLATKAALLRLEGAPETRGRAPQPARRRARRPTEPAGSRR